MTLAQSADNDLAPVWKLVTLSVRTLNPACYWMVRENLFLKCYQGRLGQRLAGFSDNQAS